MFSSLEEWKHNAKLSSRQTASRAKEICLSCSSFKTTVRTRCLPLFIYSCFTADSVTHYLCMTLKLQRASLQQDEACFEILCLYFFLVWEETLQTLHLQFCAFFLACFINFVTFLKTNTSFFFVLPIILVIYSSGICLWSCVLCMFSYWFCCLFFICCCNWCVTDAFQ